MPKPNELSDNSAVRRKSEIHEMRLRARESQQIEICDFR